ncbi:hypothetical protein IEO21_03877 [Rhodonia placenta]|uniref:Uncharacterized protein n=1 Tax=Rhodonia placenta TaxID=104341 RepID=A0A8H7P4Z0_9APHY|nr:hypothetical protein IEO21_03877 [Postia placenta]
MLPADLRLAGLCLRPNILRAALCQCTRRALQTEAAPEASSSSADLFLHASSPETMHEKNVNTRLQTIFVRPWDGISSMVELYAIIRGLERHFGRIREYQVGRDTNVPNIYLPYFWARFADSESMDRVPRDPTVLKIEVPLVNSTRQGGVGLDDLYRLLKPQNYVDPTQESLDVLKSDEAVVEETVTVDVRVERSSATPFLPPHQTAVLIPGAVDTRSRVDIGVFQHFGAWGGFYTPRDSAIDDKTRFMRQARTKSAQIVREWQRKRGIDVQEEPEDSTVQAETLDVPDRDVQASEPLAPSLVEQTAASGEEDLTSSAATASVADMHTPAPPPPQKVGLSRRERILEQARHVARTPLPAQLTAVAEQQQEEKKREREREKEEEERIRVSMRERLWKIMGGKWF